MAPKQTDDDAVAAKIAELHPFEKIAARVHEIIMDAAPDLKPRLWYGMPGYAKAKSGPVICFFRVDDGTFTLGLTEKANLTPDGDAPDHLIESAWFLTDLDRPTEDRIAAIIRKAAS